MTSRALRIEITLPKPGEWRVVERSHLAAEDVSRVVFQETELTDVLMEINACLLDANTGMDVRRGRLHRLGARLAELVLPLRLREKITLTPTQIEFFLDDASVLLPVELFPSGDSVLAETMPVSRHWFCENALTVAEHGAGKQKQALVVADPAEDLSGASTEGQAIFRLLRSLRKEWQYRFFGRTFTCAELARELPNTDLLHLAAHYKTGGAESSPGIVMADGVWMPSQSTHTPGIVFANCCRAGLTNDSAGELSLVGRFLRQGTRDVVAPYLPVSDETAKEFASVFYRSFFKTSNVALAVWEARRATGPAGWMYWHFGAMPTTQAGTHERAWRGWTAVAVIAVFIAAGVLYCGYLGAKQNALSLSEEKAVAGMRSTPTTQEPVLAVPSSSMSKQGNAETPVSTPVRSITQNGGYATDDAFGNDIMGVCELHNDYDELRAALEEEDLIGERNPNLTSLHMTRAAREGDVAALRIVRDHGWPVDKSDFFGSTPLRAAVAAEKVDAVKWLVDNGADVNERDLSGGTLSHLCAYKGNLEILKYLHSKGADVLLGNDDEQTAMHFAAAMGNVPVMQWLFENGVDVTTTDNEGGTLLDYALLYKHTDAVQWAEKMSGSKNGTSKMDKQGDTNGILRISPDMTRNF